ncbi:hypothetical protein [Allokutzneria oryzae]|uniref:Uncharacterized protein n=1 Tax=Allokutzneria oryzae TaxID=1378989 RepID=A0ABV5ZWL4_9PSEU
MVNRRAASLVIAAAIMVAMVSCTSPSASETSSPSSPTGSSAQSRSPQDPILGVVTPPDEPPRECLSSVVQRKKNVPTAELAIEGQPGDVFAYEISKKDGTAVAGKSEPFGDVQRSAIFTTGVRNDEIKLVTISVTGRIGIPGKCVITTIT